jgi:hypothetical protein
MIVEQLTRLLSDKRTSLGVVAEQANVLQVHDGKAEVVAFTLRLRECCTK